MQDFRMETFLTVCKYLNYTKAAQELNLTQPAVSQHIRYLENFYQVQLFYHAGKKVELTRAGELLRNSALTFKHDEIYLMRMLQDTAKNTRNFAFGATLSVAEFMLPPDLERLICAYPQSHIRMEVGNTRELLSKLDAGELDFAVVEGEFPREEYEFLLYRKEPYVPVASRKKAEQYRNAEFRELLSERLILREPGSGTREILEQYGYHRYEISNYAKDGYACRHNIGYWNRTDYLGIGLGASSLIDPMRWKMTSDLSDYLECGKNQGDFANLREEVQTLRVSERMEEFMFLGLRLTKGIELQTFEHQFGKSFWDVYQDAADKLFSEQLLCLDESKKNLRLTDYGVDVSNYALAEFLLDH